MKALYDNSLLEIDRSGVESVGRKHSLTQVSTGEIELSLGR
jgi:hypothetical protein